VSRKICKQIWPGIEHRTLWKRVLYPWNDQIPSIWKHLVLSVCSYKA
jgi:hypothetical protein